jgi:hypothetical protein
MSPVRYELGFYIPENGILYSHRRENLESYIHINRLSSVTETKCGSCEVRTRCLYPRKRNYL